MGTRVLVTGATGYIAGFCIAELLDHGYAVRATVRDLDATGSRAHLTELAGRTGGELEFVAADLDRDEGWAAAVAGCDHVLHVASPLPPAAPADADELIRPAVEGTRRVLNAAAASGTVRRVVLTSSTAAITAGRERDDDTVRTEADWSVPERSPAYPRSKTLAERAAWDLVRDLPDGRSLELVVVNPGMVTGPLQRAAVGTSSELILRLLAGSLPGLPRLGFSLVDVRDVAVAQRLALETPAAAGNRYVLAGEQVWVREIAGILAEEFGPRGYRVPRRPLPYWLLWLVARFDPTVRMTLYLVGRRERVSAAKARCELSWTMRPYRETIVDAAASMIEHGLVRPRR